MRCSCGAVLPEDARFCHKCGKPQYEEDIARLSSPDQTPVSTPAPVSQPLASIGFRNWRAIKITMLVAGVSFFALGIFGSILPPLAFVVMFASGFASARIYQKQTSEKLTQSGGAALGAMSWFWWYLVGAPLAWISWFSDAGRKNVQDMINLSGHPEFAPILHDPDKYAALLIASLILCLIIGTVSSAFGGIMAVRMQPRGGAAR